MVLSSRLRTWQFPAVRIFAGLPLVEPSKESGQLSVVEECDGGPVASSVVDAVSSAVGGKYWPPDRLGVERDAVKAGLGRCFCDPIATLRPLRYELTAIKLREASPKAGQHADDGLGCSQRLALLYFAAVRGNSLAPGLQYDRCASTSTPVVDRDHVSARRR
jgi:hypothetical protein